MKRAGLGIALVLLVSFSICDPASGFDLPIETAFPFVLVVSSDGAEGGRGGTKIKIRDWKKTARRHAPGLDDDAQVIEHDFVIGEGDVHVGDLVVHGDLEILGELKGDAVAIGHIRLGPHALVRGDAVAIGGEVVREDGSEIRGDVVEVWQKFVPGGVSIFCRDRTTYREREERPGELFPRRSKGRVVFRYEDPDAEAVFLMGDFNDWDPEADPMERVGQVWELALPLEKGRYEYAFLVDGEWVVDPENPENVRDREKDVVYSVIHVDRRGRVQRPSRSITIRVDTAKSGFNLKSHYNRVDGFYLAGGIDIDRRTSYQPRVSTEIGYAFERETWLGEIEVEQPLIGRHGLSAGFNYHENTFAHDFDREIIGDAENMLAALFLKEDFRDYCEKVGASVFANLRAGRHNKLRVEYRNDDYNSLERNTNWAVFGKNKCFPCNPSLEWEAPYCDPHRQMHCCQDGLCDTTVCRFSGTMKSVWALYTLDYRNDRAYPTHGWYIRLGGEKAGDQMGGDFEFTKYWIDLRKYTRLAPRQYLDVRLMAGSSEDALPFVKEYYVGGIGTLTARKYKEYRGNRLVLGSLEYRVALTCDFQGAFFVDSGDAWYEEERDYDLKTDVGVALQDADADLRVSYSKKSEDLSEDGVWMLRLNRTF